MNDGAFDQNFVWYEWGFVSPEEMPRDEVRTAIVGSATGAGPSGSLWSSGSAFWPEVRPHGEEQRWPTY